jgi:hypothetical protein
MRLAAVLICLFLIAGCSGPPAPPSPWTPVADVPPDLLSVAQKKLPAVKFETARKITVNGKDALEIRGTQPNGKVREVEVDMAGNILEVE